MKAADWSAALGGRLLGRLIEFDVEAERAQLLDQHVEGFGDTRLERVVAAHDGLVDLGAAGHVVRLDGQDLLQRVGGAVGLEGPHLHLAEALSAELRLAAQRLLGNQAVRSDRTRVDLVVHEMMQLQHVDVADRHLAIERLAGAPVDQGDLTRRVETGHLQHLDDVGLVRAVEHRRREGHALAEVAGELDRLLLVEIGDLGLVGLLAVDLAQMLLDLGGRGLAGTRQHVADLLAETRRGPAEMGFEDLTDVHARRHAERVQHDVDRAALLEIRHVLERHDARDHALVAVTARHLVARLQLALGRDEDLDHLHHARRQFIAALQLVDLAVEAVLQALHRFVELLVRRLEFTLALVDLDGDLAPLAGRELAQHLVDDTGARLQALETAGDGLVHQHFLELAVVAALEDGLLVVAILGETLDFITLDGESALVLVDTAAIEHADLDDGALDARRHLQRGVAHVGGLFAEDGAQQLLFRRHRALALRRHLADEDVACLHFGADVDDARLVEVLEGFFADVRDVAADFLLAELGVAGHDLELLDVDRGEDVIAHDALGEKDRVLEVVAIPRHERDEHVAAERELAVLRRRAVGHDVALLHRVADLHERLLGDAGALVGALELQQVVDVDRGTVRTDVVRRAHDDP